ncbi:hypothetical protein, partial [Williamsia sp. 1135]|uniref:hypothetical protein n=1 Tax=Williamsia sp. 1135 TaxID=1889262 RepID=UPI001F0AE768
MKRRGIQRLNNIGDQPHQMTGRQPLPHIRRQQKLLITISMDVRLGHTRILAPNTPNRGRYRPRFGNSLCN